MLSVARGEDRRHSHRKVSSPCYATTLCAPGSSQQHGAVARTTVLLGAYLGVRLANAHSEYAHFVYKYAPNMFSFRAQYKNFVIASRLVRRGNLVETNRQTFLRPKRNATVQNGSVKNRYTRFLHSVLQSACCHRFGRTLHSVFANRHRF